MRCFRFQAAKITPLQLSLTAGTTTRIFGVNLFLRMSQSQTARFQHSAQMKAIIRLNFRGEA